MAQVKSGGRKYFLGRHATPEEASAVVEAWWAERQKPPVSGSCA